MYVPQRFRVDDSGAIQQFVRAHGFAMLVTVADGAPTASHLPIELVGGAESELRLEGHWARANPQWRTAHDGDEALAVFLGAHAYISPTWYNHENVPTWDYQSVHVYGRLEIVHDTAEVLAIVRRLSRHYEPQGAAGGAFDVDAMSPKLRDVEIRGIVGFRLRVERFEAAFKLSQHSHQADRRSIVAHLRERGGPHDEAVAEAIEAWAPRT